MRESGGKNLDDKEKRENCSEKNDKAIYYLVRFSSVPAITQDGDDELHNSNL